MCGGGGICVFNVGKMGKYWSGRRKTFDTMQGMKRDIKPLKNKSKSPVE